MSAAPDEFPPEEKPHPRALVEDHLSLREAPSAPPLHPPSAERMGNDDAGTPPAESSPIGQREFPATGHDLTGTPAPVEEDEAWTSTEEGAGLSRGMASELSERTSKAQVEAAPPLFASYESAVSSTPPRIPHLGHLLMLAGLLFLGWIASVCVALSAMHFHLFGVSTIGQSLGDVHYTLGAEAILYLTTLVGAVMLFPLVWQRSFWSGISWRSGTALRLAPLLIGAAFLCFLLALVNGWLMPGPQDAPIDKMFRIPGAAWFLFAFGVTFAPFFEELVFRGFLLPSLATAWDWLAEKNAGVPPRPLAPDLTPQWSKTSMIAASILTSLPFAGMHAAQTGYSWGPFLLLICVSLVLCAVRLTSRSLAASVLVHACYNLMLFTLMLFGTGGFRHLENM